MEAAKQAIDAAKQLQAVKDDVKGLNPASAAQTIKAANWAMDALPVITDKITMDVKLLNNLINSIKAASNL